MKTLELIFSDVLEKRHVLSPKYVSESLTVGVVQNAMNAIAAAEVFVDNEGNPLYVNTNEARYVERIVTDIIAKS
ncbi:MAG: DUF2922 domain-containing protein [Lactobacillales bacterium]|nr:DUF2922 domain-containing protein [Lactobacillales bacterium]